VSEAFDAIVIGAGAAGLMCALTAGQRGRKVLLLEHLDKLNVRPGTAMSITAANAAKLTLDVDGRSVQIERPVAERVWVRPMTSSTSR